MQGSGPDERSLDRPATAVAEVTNEEHQQSEWLNRLYSVLGPLETRFGYSHLGDDPAAMHLPERGVCFFFEPNEFRRASQSEKRIVHVGANGVSKDADHSLEKRIRQYQGGTGGAGRHRGCVFRSHVGSAIIRRKGLEQQFPEWGKSKSPAARELSAEKELEITVSAYIRQMQVLCVAIDDAAGPQSDRASVKRNVIALLSAQSAFRDASSDKWLGRSSPRGKINSSGIWNLNHVGDKFDPQLFAMLSNYVGKMVSQ